MKINAKKVKKVGRIYKDQAIPHSLSKLLARCLSKSSLAGEAKVRSNHSVFIN